MKKVIRLTESDLVRIVKRVISESEYSQNRVKYSPEMFNDEDPFRERRIPLSKFKEGDMVVSDSGAKGEVINVMFDHDENKHYYDVRFKLDGGGAYRRDDVTDDEIKRYREDDNDWDIN